MPVGEGSIKRAAGKADNGRKKTGTSVKKKKQLSTEETPAILEQEHLGSKDEGAEGGYESFGIGQQLPTYLL